MSKYLAAAREALEGTEEIELSFGPAVIKRRLNLLDLAAAGHIPITLVTEFEEIGRKAKKAKQSPGAAALEHFETLAPAIDAVAIAAFVDPPVAKVGDDEHLAVGSIPFIDKLTVFQRLNQEVEALRGFRQGPGEANGVARAGDALPLPAVGDSGS